MSDAGDRRDLREVRSDRVRDLRQRVRRRRGYRWAVRVGLALSLVLHLVLLVVLGRQLRMPDMGLQAPPSPELVPPPGLQLTQVRTPEERDQPVPRPRRPAPAEPEQEVEQEEQEPAEAGPAAEADEEEETGRQVTNAEALTPREGDPRLWRDYWDRDVASRYLGEATRADSALRAILGRYLDSLQLSEEELRRARDWTFTEDGKRWGVSSEGIHLGDVTIPLPVGQLLQPEGPRRRELERELRELREIRRQQALGEAAETREERIEAMEERAREQREDGGSASDTTDGDGGS